MILLWEDCICVWNFGARKAIECLYRNGIFCESLDDKNTERNSTMRLACKLAERNKDSIAAVCVMFPIMSLWKRNFTFLGKRMLNSWSWKINCVYGCVRINYQVHCKVHCKHKSILSITELWFDKINRDILFCHNIKIVHRNKYYFNISEK